MSTDRARRQRQSTTNDTKRLGALEKLKQSRLTGEKISLEDDESEHDIDHDEYSDYENYDQTDELSSNGKRKSKQQKQQRSVKRLKNEQSKTSDNDDEAEDVESDSKQKIKDSKRRGQTYSKPQEDIVVNNDIKAMFAASKQRTIQKQEEKQKMHADDLLFDIMQELQTKTVKVRDTKISKITVPSSSATSNVTRPLPSSTTLQMHHPPPISQPKIPEKTSDIQNSLMSNEDYLAAFSDDFDDNPITTIEKQKVNAIDWGDDDDSDLLANVNVNDQKMSNKTNDAFMGFQSAEKLLRSTSQSLPLRPTSMQYETQELQFVSDEELIKSTLTTNDTTLSSTTSANNETNSTTNQIHVFWFDAYEDNITQAGKLFLFGKMPLKNDDLPTATYVSVCIIIENIPKQIYLLPKQNNSVVDVQNEFEGVAKKYKITNYTCSIVKKKRYECDLSSTDGLVEMDYVEIKYPARCSSLPSNLQGDTFSHIFGTNQYALEYVLVDKKLKGPCWLKIRQCIPVKLRRSWCKVEYSVDYYSDLEKNLSNVEINFQRTDLPPVVTLTLSFVTLPNTKTHETELVSVAGLVHQQFPIDRGAPNPQYQNYFVALTKTNECILPVGLSKVADTQNIKLETVASERALLTYLISKLQTLDPDVIVGHDMRMFGLELFLTRCQKLKVGLTSSKIGRLHRIYDSKTKVSAIKNPTYGRLLCDISVSARELLTKCKSYDLDELCKTVLTQQQYELYRQYNIEQIRDSYNTSSTLIDLVQATLNNTSLILNIFCQLMVLPLAYQLTCIAGNLLSRTLMGGRSERNDHLLLHAFTEKDYIVPDKVPMQRAGKRNDVHLANESDEDDQNADVGNEEDGKKKKASSSSYTGGLVLQPKKGFYDRYILLLDFNSLYPSIIQEFNVCFTTYLKKPLSDKNNGDLTQPDKLPSNHEEDGDDDEDNYEIIQFDSSSTGSKGILPLEIYKLVERRREVKKLIKEKKNATEEQLVQYDIRQKAYKLTANSLYGCLGFKYSRFYCKPLAAFITYKGRDMNYDVIYGDTDSIMINTNSIDYDQVLTIGSKIRNEINRQFKHIEIGIDGVFKCMLLLKKKKYAALIIEKSPITQEFITKTELKGLDIVRRDWCQLARQTGAFVVSIILSGQSRDDVLDTIHNRLRELGEEMSNNLIDIHLYEIVRQLSKDPKDYPDKKSLPHVQVALRLNSNSTGRKMKRGDAIAYIICEDGTNLPAMQRAYTKDEIALSTTLKIDNQYYLHQQILPVVSRLMEPFEGTDQAIIAQCLGLDPSRYKHRHVHDKSDDQNQMLSELETYKNCEKFTFQCFKCQTKNEWNAPFIFSEGDSCSCILLHCLNKDCKMQPLENMAFIRNNLTLAIKNYIKRYYENWLKCEDEACQ
ncbi:unnamed protein product, partial [Didymodactylos carnosus]